MASAEMFIQFAKCSYFEMFGISLIIQNICTHDNSLNF